MIYLQTSLPGHTYFLTDNFLLLISSIFCTLDVNNSFVYILKREMFHHSVLYIGCSLYLQIIYDLPTNTGLMFLVHYQNKLFNF